MPVEVVANSVLAFTDRPIFNCRAVTVVLHNQKVIHKGSEYLDIYRNSLIILLLTLFFDCIFSCCDEVLLLLVGISP